MFIFQTPNFFSQISNSNCIIIILSDLNSPTCNSSLRQIGWCLMSGDKSFMFIATIIFLKFSLFYSNKSKQFEFVRPDMFVVTVVKNMPCYGWNRTYNAPERTIFLWTIGLVFQKSFDSNRGEACLQAFVM